MEKTKSQYRRLQKVAKTMELPGNMKMDVLKEVIKARKSGDEETVKKILQERTERKANRKNSNRKNTTSSNDDDFPDKEMSAQELEGAVVQFDEGLTQLTPSEKYFKNLLLLNHKNLLSYIKESQKLTIKREASFLEKKYTELYTIKSVAKKNKKKKARPGVPVTRSQNTENQPHFSDNASSSVSDCETLTEEVVNNTVEKDLFVVDSTSSDTISVVEDPDFSDVLEDHEEVDIAAKRAEQDDTSSDDESCKIALPSTSAQKTMKPVWKSSQTALKEAIEKYRETAKVSRIDKVPCGDPISGIMQELYDIDGKSTKEILYDINGKSTKEIITGCYDLVPHSESEKVTQILKDLNCESFNNISEEVEKPIWNNAGSEISDQNKNNPTLISSYNIDDEWNVAGSTSSQRINTATNEYFIPSQQVIIDDMFVAAEEVVTSERLSTVKPMNQMLLRNPQNSSPENTSLINIDISDLDMSSDLVIDTDLYTQNPDDVWTNMNESSISDISYEQPIEMGMTTVEATTQTQQEIILEKSSSYTIRSSKSYFELE